MSLSFPVAGALFHPPYGFTRRELVPGLFSGSGDLERDTGALPPFNHVNAYGLRWTFFTVPDGIGRRFGSPDIFDRRMLQLTARYRNLDDSDDDLEVLEVFSEHTWFWQEPGPLLIHYEIYPFVEVVFEWLIVRFP